MRAHYTFAPAWLALMAVAGCPPREVTVRVSFDGAQRVLNACTPDSDACMSTPAPDFAEPLMMQAQLLDSDGTVAKRGACVALDLDNCINAGRPLDGAIECLQNELNRALDATMAGGLTYSDLEDDSDATLIVTTHAADGACPLDVLVSCAVFQVPLGADDYDVGCAVCAGGEPAGVGCTVTDRCVFGECVQPGDCALDVCRRVLE